MGLASRLLGTMEKTFAITLFILGSITTSATERQCYVGEGDSATSQGCDSFVPNPQGTVMCFISGVGEMIDRNCIDSADVEGDDTTDDIVVPEEDGSTCGTITDPEDSSNITFCLCAWDNCNKDFETAETTTATTATTTTLTTTTASHAGQLTFFLPMLAAVILSF